jgi:hypothetical protein
MTEEELLLWYGVKRENELLRDREAVLLPTYRDGGRFVNNHNVLVHVNYGDRVGGNRYFMPETNQQCSFDTITHSTGGRGTTFTLVHKMHCKNNNSSWQFYCPNILWWPVQSGGECSILSSKIEMTDNNSRHIDLLRHINC